ncbi:cytochrome P450 [Suillus variegatus]|nr:cytochrome P450 [Suillus variegatus]
MFPSVDGRLAILAVLPASVVIITSLKRFIRNRQDKLPPGPVPLPLLGNFLSLDAKSPWLTYTEWAATYGDLFFVRLLDQDVVVISSQHVAEALMDKRGCIYSDRPYLATVEPFGWSVFFVLTGYGDEWRLCRRLIHQTFRPDSALKFRPMQIKQAGEMIVNLIDDPHHYHSHFATFSSSVAMSTTYGYQTSPRDDPLVRIVENALAVGIAVVTPERAALLKAFSFFDILYRHAVLKLPDWCWGSSIKHDARTSANRMREMTDVPFQYAQDHMTTSILMTFSLAMVLYPDVQRRAQAEIDSVVGRDRLPTFEDRPSLPYIESVFRETLRWQPIGPLGVAHASMSDDTYDGYFIPKGTTIMWNTWGITRDEKRYPDASRFMPERFLDVNGALTNDSPAGYIFGFGRRVCPGRYAADASVWSAIVTMLATVEFSSAKDDQGKVIEFTPQFTMGLFRSPMVFPCNISSRSRAHSELVNVFRTEV